MDSTPNGPPKSTHFLNASDVTFRVGTDGGELGAASERVCLWIMREGDDMAVVEISTTDLAAWMELLKRTKSACANGAMEAFGLALKRAETSIDRFMEAAANCEEAGR